MSTSHPEYSKNQDKAHNQETSVHVNKPLQTPT